MKRFDDCSIALDRKAVRLGVTAGIASVIAWVATAHALEQRELIDGFESIPSEVDDAVAAIFPEQSAVGQSYLSDTYSPNLFISETATVTVTFVHEGAGYRNALGYFTYSIDGGKTTILDRQLIFPNASHADSSKGWGGGQLVPGDTATLRDAAGEVRVFEPGTRIGFFLVADGWNNGAVIGWNESAPAIPSELPAANAAVARGVFTTVDELNPEALTDPTKMRHVAMVRMAGGAGLFDGEDFFLAGFEDQRRDGSSDEDFNDLVFVVHSTPETATEQTEVIVVSNDDPDPDGDGVEGIADYFPYDPDRAFVVRTPAVGYATLAYEDNYPAAGDGDYNDAVVRFAFEQGLDADGNLRDLVGTFHLVARGASFDHRFGLRIDGLPLDVAGQMAMERFSYDESGSLGVAEAIAGRLEEGADGALRLHLSDLFPSTITALPPAVGTNTDSPSQIVPPASVRFMVTFEQPIDPVDLDAAPYDPYLAVQRGTVEHDIHLPGRQPLTGRPASLPDEAGDPNFIDANLRPWALIVPNDWRFPLEKVQLSQAYPGFDAWAASEGAQQTTWFDFPVENGSSPLVIDPPTQLQHARPWTVKVGTAL